MNLMFYGNSLKWFVTQYATCTNEQSFVSNEMGDTLKGMADSFIYKLNQLIDAR